MGNLNKRGIGFKLGFILSLFLILNATGFLIVLQFIAEQSSDGKVINIAGAQRMLSQKMSKESLLVANGDSTAKKGLSETIQQFESAQNDLLDGNKENGIPAVKLLAIRNQLNVVMELWQNFEPNVEVVLNETNPNKVEAAIKYIKDNNLNLLQEANKAVSLFEEESKSKVSKLQIIQGVLLVANLIMVIIGIYISRRIITKPINNTVDMLKDIAEGEGDLTRRLLVTTNDETGELSRWFNKFIDNIQDIIQQVNISAESVAAASEELTAISEQTTQATNQIASAIQEVASGAETQLQGAEETAKSMEEMAQGIQRIAETSSIVSEESMKTTKVADQGNESVQKAVQQMNSISESVNDTASVVKLLGERSQEIGQIVGVITDISDQTNLLALNAAIEAARAGEHGRGFAVVADEVRKLAEQSKESADQITTLIKGIQEDTTRSVYAMDGVTKEVQVGMDVVNQSGEAFVRILNAAQHVADQIQEVSAISEEMSASSEEVTASVEDMTRIASDSSSNSQNVASSSQEQLASIEEISASADSLSKMAQELQEVISKFKI